MLRLRSDEQLVAAFRQGQEAAFQVIHDRYKARLFAYARQMLGGSPQDAEDALQDVFLRAYNTLRADARPITLRAWLYRVAHNRCIDQMRRPAPVPVEASEDSPSDAPEPMAAAQQREDLRRLVSDIRALPQQQRSALLMREMDGMTYTELGAALGVTIPAVKSLLVRARMGLAETGEARDADCHEICADLAASHDRGVRSSGRARRHLRDCNGCRAYRVALKGTSTGIAALGPASPGLLAGLAQALGLGGAGSGALVAGAGGGGTVATGSGALAVGATTTKVAAVLGAAAVAAAGVAEVEQRMASPAPPASERATSPPPVVPPVAGAPTPDTVARAAEAEKEREEAEREKEEGEEAQEEEEPEAERGEEQEADRDGAPAPEQQLAQAPGGGGGGASSSGSSGGGRSEGAEGAVRETGRRGERLLAVPEKAVSGLLDTVRRATGPKPDGGQAERAAGESSAPRGRAAGNDRGGEPERRPPRATE
ncbi:MAG: sigma-70 family RNA polymerase sigma factor [Solirubrobacterales bacterium]|nr:sigma-70 family RNA polymerase sigma factor [Solirubrobacterales bacterium]